MTSLDNELQEQGMSASCCGQDAQFDGVSAAFKRALWIVIAINGASASTQLWSASAS